MAALAQPVDLPIPAAATGEYPPGVKVAATPSGPVYVDRKGRTLYGMDMRTLIRWAPEPSQYCQEACRQIWEPLLAPAGSEPNIAYPHFIGPRPASPPGATGAAPPPARPAGPAPGSQQAQANVFASAASAVAKVQNAPDWTIIAGPTGPQWVYKGWHMVYVRKGDRPRSTAHDGADGSIWNTLKFVPPVPKITAPSTVTTRFDDGRYALADRNGHTLFSGTCRSDCGGWVPLAAGMASRGMGDWTVSLAGDAPQWAWRGKPVFVSQDTDPASVPAGGMVLRP